jgi:WD40 repeat protein
MILAMSEPSRAVTEIPKRRWLSRLRFSLRTLLCFILLVGSAIALWKHWAPWRVERMLSGHTQYVSHGFFSPDGNRAATCGYDKTVRVWNVQTGTQMHVIKTTDDEPSVAFSRDSSSLVVENRILGQFPRKTDSIDVWNVDSGQKISVLTPMDWDFASPRFCPDGAVISDRVLCLWDAASGQKKLAVGTLHVMAGCSFPTEEQQKRVHKEEELACAIADLDTYASHTSGFYVQSAVSSDGSVAVTTIMNGKAQVWDTVTHKKISSIEAAVNIDEVLLSPTGNRMARVNNENLEIWNTHNAEIISIVPDLFEREKSAFSATGDFFVNYTYNNKLRIWNSATGQLLFASDPRQYTEFSLSSDDRCMALISLNGENEIEIRSLQNGDLLSHIFIPSASTVYHAEFSADGKRILTSGDTALLWSRRRPEWWWGAAWLPEFWLTALLGVCLVWSVWRDRKSI